MKYPSRLLITAIAVLCIVVLAACSSGGKDTTNTDSSNKTPAANKTSDKETAPKTDNGSDGAPIKISIFAQQNPDTDLVENSFSKVVAEKFNLDISWQVVPFDSAQEARQISLASGDYPDLYLLIPWVDQFSQTDLIRYGKQKVILPLNDLIEEHAPNIKRTLDEHPYYAAMSYAPDGNIYGLNQLIECYHCSYPNKMWINQVWLDNLGLDMPTTLDDFLDVMRAFKNDDPNGNGIADEIPLSGANTASGTHLIPFFMNAFIYNDDRNYMLLDNGQVDIAANKEEWREGLRFVRLMHDEELIDPGAFTQNAEAMKQLGDYADHQILGAGAGMHPNIFVTSNTEPSKSYDPVPPLTGPTGLSYATYNYPSSPGGTFVLTNKASEEAQIAAIKMLDYLFTEEGQIRGHFGEKDLSWKDPEPGDEAFGVEPILKTIPGEVGAPPRNDNWGARAQYYQPVEFRNSWVASTDIYSPQGYERRLYEATLRYDGHEPDELFPLWALWVDPDEADEVAMIRQNITDYIDQNALMFVTGAKDLDKDWDDYLQGFNSLNLDRYLQLMQETYNRSFN